MLFPGVSTPMFSLTQQHAAWIVPFFCYQICDFALNTLVAVSIVVYPNTIQDYLLQLVREYTSSNLQDGIEHIQSIYMRFYYK